MRGTISRGQYSEQVIVMDGDLVVTGGCGPQAQITAAPHHLTLNDGHWPAVEVDGAVLRPEALPANVTLGPSMLLQPDFLPNHTEPLPGAVTILNTLRDRNGEDGLAAWLWTVAYVLAGTADLAYATWRDAYAVWSNGNNNGTFSTNMFKAIAAYLLGKDVSDVSDADWGPLLTAIRLYDLDTWSGLPTQPGGG